MNAKYRRMLAGMQEKQKKGRTKGRAERWFLYLLKCSDGSLYTGITKDVACRLKVHNEGRASRYTRVRRPVELIYQEPCGSRTDALLRELAVKSWPREKKEALTASNQTGPRFIS